MSRALGPRGGLPREALLPLTVLALCWTPAGAAALVWAAGRAAAALTGTPSGPPFGWPFARALAAGGPPAVWPATPPVLVWTLTGLLTAVVLAPLATGWWRWQTRRPTPGDPLPSLARPADVAALTPTGVAARAAQLRPALRHIDRRHLPGAELGVSLGELLPRGPLLRASWEDVLLAVMAPRAGKTTALAVPAILDAPGPVIATSNKAELWTATAGPRETATGQPEWLFDPQGIAHAPQRWWWNPLRAITTVEEAHRLAGHFVQEVRTAAGDRDFWTAAAHDLLTALLLAAAGSHTLLDVYEWLNDPMVPTPEQLLADHGHHPVAASLRGRKAGAPETREGVYETARTAAQCLRDPAILAWVTPPSRPLPELDPAAFVTGRAALYLCSKDGAGAAAPLVAALTDRVLRAAVRAAERGGGRLDPPLVVVLDEAANVCRIADLPDLYSHLGARGIVPLTILQSYRQGVRVWGEPGMDALWSAATVKLVGAGIDDARFAEDLSRLVGEHDVPVRSLQYGERTSEAISLRRQRILAPDDLRALPRGRALLLATGCRPALLRLLPWYTSPRAAAVHAALADANQQLTTRAQAPAR